MSAVPNAFEQARHTCQEQLMTGERMKLAFYIQQDKQARAIMLQNATLDPQTSGPLLRLYRYLKEI